MNLASPGIILTLVLLVELQLFTSLYFCYEIIKHMRDDLEYSVTLIFLSQKSVKGMKALMASLIAYAVLNLVTVLGTTGSLFEFLLRANLVVLFGGLMYYFRQISKVTAKSE